MAVMKWMDPSKGHDQMVFDPAVHPEVLAAERKFEQLLADQQDHVGAQTMRRRAYVVTVDPGTGRKVADKEITKFDPAAEEIMIISPMQGGAPMASETPAPPKPEEPDEEDTEDDDSDEEDDEEDEDEDSEDEASGTLHITNLGEGVVKVKADRPGERAVSAKVDGRELIQVIAKTIGVEVDIA